MEERIYYLGFNLFYEKLGPLNFKKIIKKFKKASLAWQAKRWELEKMALPKAFLSQFFQKRDRIDLERELKKLKKLKIDFIIITDPAYPKLLKAIPDPPYLLFYKGNKNILKDLNNFAIVGTRRPSFYGKEVAKYFSRELVRAGFTIVSGLAMGIDIEAQKEAIENNGYTIGVSGCGLDILYPSVNQPIVKKITESGRGIILSEFPLGTPPRKTTFPIRNRVIAGISLGTLVIEGEAESGSLITANFALEYNRYVFAVPGSIFSSRSRGPHKLIKEGAKLVEEPEDILDEIPKSKQIINKIQIPKSKFQNLPVNLNEQEKELIQILENKNMSLEGLAKKTKMSINKIITLATNLEIKGIIKDIGGKNFTIIK